MTPERDLIVITGLGVISAIGEGVDAFTTGLRQGTCGIRHFAGSPPYTGAFLPEFSSLEFLKTLPECPEEVKRQAQRILRQAPESVHITSMAAVEAWLSAGWHRTSGDAERIGIVVGGNNISQRYLSAAWRKFQDQPDFLSPRHAFLALDTNLVSSISEILGIQGCGLTAGGASASGNVALWNAKHLLESGVADCILVCGASPELSRLELQAFRLLGAAAPVTPDIPPETLYRPFDCTSQGFVPGEGSACIVLETASSARHRGAQVWATLAGDSLVLHASHLPQANTRGEVRAMQLALADAKLGPDQIDYVNAHGSGSSQGDACECEALSEVFGKVQPWLNATKSLTGHCLSASGLIEVAACAIQMRQGFLHPNRNLCLPTNPGIRFTGYESLQIPIQNVLSNSFGFGGFNSSIVLRC